MSELTTAKRSRATRRTYVTRLIAESEAAILAGDRVVAEQKLALLEVKESELYPLNQQIEGLTTDDAEFEVEMQAVQEFSETIVICKINLTRFLNQVLQVPPAAATVSKFPATVKLPKLQIRKFDGTLQDWERFWDQFESGVHKNTTLSSIDKFNYLKGFLSDAAALTIAGVPLSDGNYTIALDLLKNKYGRSDILVTEHFNQLLRLRAVENCNGSEVRRLLEEVRLHTRSIETLGQDVKTLGSILCPVVLQALPKTLLLEWNRLNGGKTKNNLEELLLFIETEVTGLEQVARTLELKGGVVKAPQVRKGGNQGIVRRNNSEVRSTASSLLVTEPQGAGNTVYCIFCETSDHRSSVCDKHVDNRARREAIKRSRRCYRCLGQRHVAKFCQRFLKCRSCGQSHHTLLCPNRDEKRMPNSSSAMVADNKQSVASDSLPSNVSVKTNLPAIAVGSTAALGLSNGVAILQTLRVWIKSESWLKEAICLIDNGSERSFITSRLVQEARLTGSKKEVLQINAFGGKEATKVERKFAFTLQGANGVQLEIDAFEVPTICQNVSFWENSKIESLLQGPCNMNWPLVMGREERVSIDILVGADWYWRLMTGHMKRLSSFLMASESLFGWVLQGRSPLLDQESVHRHVTSLLVHSQSESKDNWSQEFKQICRITEDSRIDKEEESKRTLQDEMVLEEFYRTTTFENGRYTVCIPWKEERTKLCDNFKIAEERLRRLLFRLRQDPQKFKRYQDGIFAYLSAGHTEEVDVSQATPELTYYMPHHPIIKEERKTTKLRIVFDASSHSVDCQSLNRCQYAGPNLNPCIASLLLNFRQYQVAFVSDIQQAFLQIALHPKDRDVTRFLWLNDAWINSRVNKYQVFRMCRVLFGMKASPFLLAATTRLHAEKYQEEYPDVVAMIKDNMYVDDVASGASDAPSAYEKSKIARNIMQEGGFPLVKWATNDKKLRQLWIEDGLVPEEEPRELLKILGLMWNTQLDQFSFKTLTPHLQEVKATKRGILELIGRLYDPLGFLGPCSIGLRKLMQEIWRQNLGWDEELKVTENQTWEAWKEDLQCLDQVVIPRWVNTTTEKQELELHIFCDASPHAYGAVAYVLSREGKQAVTRSLIASKSRIAPLKVISIARLELMACLEGAILLKFIQETWKIQFSKLAIWSDSTIALHWLNSSPLKWKLFVGRRVKEFQSKTQNCKLLHCPGKMNVADRLSRGCYLKQLLQQEEWWKGPDWLANGNFSWDCSYADRLQNGEELTELNPTASSICMMATEEFPIIAIDGFNTWKQLVEVTAWMMRFVENARCKKEERITSGLTFEELKRAQIYWLKWSQKMSFPEELQRLQEKKVISRSSSIIKFAPYLDDKGLIRLGGRLKFAQLSEDQKHPVLLKGSRLIELFVLDAHVRTLHGGVQETLNQIRKGSWLIKGRQTVRKVIRQCLKCRRWDAPLMDSSEGPLPALRIKPSPVFENCGIDHTGPLWLKADKGKEKAYICLFTCAVTRAVHLELASSLGTEAFILAFRRFTSRRGCCKYVFSDNGQAFRQTDRLLHSAWTHSLKPRLEEEAAKIGIQWSFIPPRASWWGGFYERLIGSVKKHLRRTLGNACLTYEELNTILVEIEAILNSRPLMPLTEDIADKECLTPFHFILGQKATSLFDLGLDARTTEIKPAFQKRWRHQNQVLSKFWKQWKQEYLLQLTTAHQVKQKRGKGGGLQKDAVVIVQEDKIPRSRWKLAKIQELIEGRDGVIRSVILKTASGDLIRRAMQHIAPLEYHFE